MTPELETSLSAQLRALRVDPPDDGFTDRLTARLEREAPARLERSNVTRLFGKRRGLILLSAAAVFVSGGALALLDVAPLSWHRPSEPAAVPAEPQQARETDSPPARARVPRVERTPQSDRMTAPPEAPEPPRQLAVPAIPPRRLPSPVERSPERTHALSDDRQSAPPEAARPQPLRVDLDSRSIPELPLPIAEREQRSNKAPGEHPQAIPRLNADLRRPGSDTGRRERFERPGMEERQHKLRSTETERTREIERTREGRVERPEDNNRERGRRRSE
jgi:hypothetical protein